MSPQDELPELDANELALLAAFADDEAPGAAARERVKARVVESTAPSVPTGTVLRGPWVPWVAGTVLAAAAAALLVLTMSDSGVAARHDPSLQQAPNTPEATEDIRARQEAAPAPARRPPTAASPGPAVQPSVQPSLQDEAPTEVLSAVPLAPEPAAPSTPRRRASTTRKKTAPLEAPTAASPTSLAEETRLLDRARLAVVENRPKDALSLLRDAQSRFPQGVLRQERAVLRVVALCDAGALSDGRKAAAAFLRTHPQSALRSRVHSACPEATP